MKQLQVEASVKSIHCDIVHLQEAHIEEDTFSTCDCICSYNIMAYLESSVEKLLFYPAVLNPSAQQVLLDEVVPVFTAQDNKKILTLPPSKDVRVPVCNSNLNVAPVSDVIPILRYKEFWSVLGEPDT